MKKTAIRLSTILVVAYLLACLYLFVQQRSFLYHGGNKPVIEAALAAGYQRVEYTAADGQKLWGLYRPPPSETAPMIIVFHGNAGIDNLLDDHALPLSTLPVGIFLTTYRGFDGNDGISTEAGLQQDAQAAYDFAKNQGISTHRIVLYGQSLGTGVAAYLAALVANKMPAAGLILEAPFTRMVDMAKLRYWYMPVDWLLQDRYDTINNLADIQAPVLIMHGEADKVIPISMGKALCNAAKEPKKCVWFPGAGHTDLYAHNAFNSVQEFVNNLTTSTAR